MHAQDTIVAVATAPGTGAIGIVRLSGPQAWPIWAQLCGFGAAWPAPRQAQYLQVGDADGETLDTGLGIGFRAPRSYTGEDSVELQLHGNPLVLEQVQRRCIALGARAAGPGEFSQRAFVNGKLDLAQAEAVADLISAASEDAVRAAQHSLQGVFSRRCEALTTEILELRALLEAWLDFPDEDLGPTEVESWGAQLQGLVQARDELRQEAGQGCQLQSGMRVLIVGAPNAGKSTLLNALARREVAIVSDIQGTTRDLVSEHIVLNGVPIHLIDSAGLRDSPDPIERAGVERAHAAAKTADLVISLDAPDAALPALPTDWAARVLRVRNKCDLSGLSAGWRDETLLISAREGAGLDELALAVTGRQPHQSGFSARQRHLDALDLTGQHLRQARPLLDRRPPRLELVAEELRQAQAALAAITGEVSNEDLLGQIFSTFCIGK